MGVRRTQEVDTSFCTETEILEETAILPPSSGACNNDNQDPSSHIRVGFALETPGAHATRQDVSSDEDEYDDYVVDSGRRRMGIGVCVKSRPCAVCLYLALVLLLLSSFVSVLVVGVLVAAPYQHASKYRHTQCTPTQLSVEKQLRKCSCGKGCSSKYPCLRIIVGYQGSHGYVESTLFDDESSLGRQCSFYPPCLTSKDDNYAAVRHYELQYGRSNQPFTCLYDPDKPALVIRRRRFKLHHVVHGLVWSIALFLSSLALLTFALRYKGCAVL